MRAANSLIFDRDNDTVGASLPRGVRFFGEGYRTYTLVMTSGNNSVCFVDTLHIHRKPGPRGARLY